MWRFDGDQSKPVPVESECAADWHYTAKDASTRESMFNMLETKYANVLDRIWSNKTLSDKQKLWLLLMMLDLHCRNPAYKNLTGIENIYAYDALIHCLRILLGDSSEIISDSQLLSLFTKRLANRTVADQFRTFVNYERQSCLVVYAGRYAR
jgi:hypothetical protein